MIYLYIYLSIYLSTADYLVTQLPLWEVAQDLQSTDPTQETCVK